MATLNTDIRYIKGVGEARAKSLAKLGITDLRSLLSYFPRTYDDRRAYKKIADLIPGENACVCAVIAGEPRLSRIRKGLDLVKLPAGLARAGRAPSTATTGEAGSPRRPPSLAAASP